jgi:glycosyltransferase involved in cell wall biosynthesis
VAKGAAVACASVVIPAHNEESLIGKTLRTLLADADADEFEVIVVCNSCTDATAAVAREHAGVTVIERFEASKVAALNAGDAVATTFPRIYLDADIALDTASLRSVVAVLRAGAPAAAPAPIVDTSQCGIASRAYFAIWSRTGYATANTLGSGVYGMSEKGRARFTEFPDLISDDGFVYSQFTQSERVNPPGATFTIQAPRTISALVKRRIRIVAGNRQLESDAGRQVSAPGPTWRDVVRSERRLVPAAAVYATVNAVAALAARRRARQGTAGAWHQDRSIRGGSN